MNTTAAAGGGGGAGGAGGGGVVVVVIVVAAAAVAAVVVFGTLSYDRALVLRWVPEPTLVSRFFFFFFFSAGGERKVNDGHTSLAEATPYKLRLQPSMYVP